MVPFYLCYMGGLSMTELRGDGEISPGAQRRMIFSSASFALGVTSIFMLPGMGAMLIVFAILIATGGVTLIADAMIRWFPGFTNLG